METQHAIISVIAIGLLMYTAYLVGHTVGYTKAMTYATAKLEELRRP